ncbi:MAG TPA: carbamoyltransferase HypF [Gemmatimonadaceae bacterium]|nr:carbamoyltransferase HypF [Gemmatimonadaceae bacterium]
MTGVVQGVGFRPFIHRLAVRLGLAGWVRNVAGTVEIHVEGPRGALDAFERLLPVEAPPVSRIDALRSTAADVQGTATFTIAESTDAGGNRPVPPDVAICAACERELHDADGRRYRHPFITCTDCGPRYTVIDALPYDRERTSMAAFPMCASCRAEYEAPGDRRFHAETVACNDCGPQLWLADTDAREMARGPAAIRDAGNLLAVGRIVAVRGVGGFHLACDATSQAAVQRLRARKARDAKPLAVMVATLDDARAIGIVSRAAERLLQGPERPIVLLPRRPQSRVAPSVAPNIGEIGVMLPYTPLHHLLLEAARTPLVMTSGNRSDEPIAIGNAEAVERLGAIADCFLLHDREILSRVDDSVVRLVDDEPVLLRRSRGYAPLPVRLPVAAPVPLVAVGPHLKNTFTLAAGDAAFMSPHIGDLEGMEAFTHYHAALRRYRDLFRIDPQVAVRDLHPGYLSTRIAAEMGLPRIIAVQHHHAHVAAVLAEHGEAGPAVGIALDGTGYGDDGRIWGAEVMVASLTGYRRKAHLRYAPLPGGDTGAREPWRAAAGYLSLAPSAAGAMALAFERIAPQLRAVVTRQLERNINAPPASSMGRLFDAAAAILGVRSRASFEGQAAMELETLAGTRPVAASGMAVRDEDGMLVIDPVPTLVSLGERAVRGDDRCQLAAEFHESIVNVVARVGARVALEAGLRTVALGGGSFQNARLLRGVRYRLEEAGLRVLVPRQLGPNDGAISYGQAAIAAAVLAAERTGIVTP